MRKISGRFGAMAGVAALMGMMLGAAILAPAQAQTYTVVHRFTGTDGANTEAGLVRDAAGDLYGTTAFGGASGYGTVFEVDRSGKERVLHSFSGGTDGVSPWASLVIDASGNVYGTTVQGGESTNCGLYGCGTVFELDPTGNETVLYTFAGSADGAFPYAGLTRDSEGNLYGTAFEGGGGTCSINSVGGCGTVFKLDSTGKESVLYTFSGGTDGANPAAGLVRDSAGNLYGTTTYGGAFNSGTVFKLDTTGTETVLYSFAGLSDGSYPSAGLLRDPAGNLHGTTYLGGSHGIGTVFKVDKNGTETLLHSFTGAPDGANPIAGLIRGATGDLHGTTSTGGAYRLGTVFRLDASGTETVLHNFVGREDGRYPHAGLVTDPAGNLCGTTYNGGDTPCSDGCGVVFGLKP